MLNPLTLLVRKLAFKAPAYTSKLDATLLDIKHTLARVGVRIITELQPYPKAEYQLTISIVDGQKEIHELFQIIRFHEHDLQLSALRGDASKICRVEWHSEMDSLIAGILDLLKSKIYAGFFINFIEHRPIETFIPRNAVEQAIYTGLHFYTYPALAPAEYADHLTY